MINTKRYPAGPASHIESHLYFPAAITNHGPTPPVADLTGDLAYLRTSYDLAALSGPATTANIESTLAAIKARVDARLTATLNLMATGNGSAPTDEARVAYNEFVLIVGQVLSVLPATRDASERIGSVAFIAPFLKPTAAFSTATALKPVVLKVAESVELLYADAREWQGRVPILPPSEPQDYNLTDSPPGRLYDSALPVRPSLAAWAVTASTFTPGAFTVDLATTATELSARLDLLAQARQA